MMQGDVCGDNRRFGGVLVKFMNNRKNVYLFRASDL